MFDGERWALYQTLPAFVLGFHGCDLSVGEAILHGRLSHLKASENDYDWLGSGVYFWESNPQRALEFAQERAGGSRNSRGAITEPFVLGAIIDPGHCLNLIDSSALRQVKDAYELLKDAVDDDKLPSNGAHLLVRRHPVVCTQPRVHKGLLPRQGSRIEVRRAQP